MEYAKIFSNGGSQVVRLPKSCRFDQDEVLVNRIGKAVVLLPKDDPWAAALQGLSLFTDDYLSGGMDDLPVQERNGL